MPVVDSDTLRAIAASSGLSPYDIIVEWLPDQQPSTFASFTGAPSPNMTWQQLAVEPQTLNIAYGNTKQTFTFNCWDPSSVEAPQVLDPSVLIVPTNGIWICVTVKDQTAPSGRCLFRGMVRAVHDDIMDAALKYNVEAMSDISRLNCVYVNMVINFRNDPISPNAVFNNDGSLQAIARLKTVYEIIQDIMNYQDAWQTPEYFQFSDIEWNGLDTDPRCGGYVPRNINAGGVTKADLIQQVLTCAGNFTYMYNPDRNSRGKINIVEINLACNNCGDLWNINYAPTTVGAAAFGVNYAFNHQIAEDNSTWDTEGSANVIRVVSDKIRFYSGNWMIPEILDGDNFKNVVQIEQDTVAQQKKRAINLDLCNYRFTYAYDAQQDIRAIKNYPVGLPLFPDWNIHEDYLPAFLEIQSIMLPPGTSLQDGNDNDLTPTSLAGLVEYQAFTTGDEVGRGTPRQRNINNMRAYQAYFSRNSCPACTPSGWPVGAPSPGLVDSVYTGDNNEPNIQWYFVDGSGNRREAGPTDYPNLTIGERMTFSVTNYRFNPMDFGTGAPPSGGLIPWTGSTKYGTTGAKSSYPLPWKNLCPYCRGTGMKPEFKIRNIQPDLFEGRNNQITSTNGVNEVPVDTDYTQTGPETFEQALGRVFLTESASVSIETPIMYPSVPVFGSQNKTFPNIKAITPADNQHNEYPNPLVFQSLTKRIPIVMGIDPTAPSAQIVPSNWTCHIPFTTINFGVSTDGKDGVTLDSTLGRVLFTEPQFISCWKQYTNYSSIDGKAYLVDGNGCLQPQYNGNGQWTADSTWYPTGFWRHARAWLQCYYYRARHYEYMQVDMDGNTIPTIKFQAPAPDGSTGNYIARTSINDGCLVFEVQKTNATSGEAGGTLFPTGNLLLQKSIDESDARIETTLQDLYAMPMPDVVNLQPAAYETYKRGLTTNNQNYPEVPLQFPRARYFKFEQTTTGEQQAEMDGYEQLDYYNSIWRPKLFSWRMWDDRTVMLARALQELESANQLLVGGTIKLVGMSNDLNSGLGYVNKPNMGKAAVKQITYMFSEALTCEIEISREQGKFGDIVPTQDQRMHNITSDVSRLGRVTQALESQVTKQTNQAPTAGNFNFDTDDGFFYF